MPMRPTICGITITESHPRATQTAGATQIGALRQTSFARGRDQRAAPHRRQQRHSPGRVDDEQPDRSVGAGDERIDRRVVESTHPASCARRPGEPMEQPADAEHHRHARRKRNGGCTRDDAVRGKRQQDAKGNRDEERQLMRDAAQTRPGRAVAGRLAGRSYRRSVGVNLETSVRSSAVRGLQLPPPATDLRVACVQGAR